MATSLVFPVLRQVQGVIEVADKCREDLKDISKYIHTLSAVLVRILGGFEPGSAWEQSFLDLLEDIFRTVFAALRLADRCILYDGFGFFAKAAAFGLEREVSRVKEQLRVDLESLNSFLLADIWVATKQQGAASAAGGSPHPGPALCPAISQRQASQAHRLLLSMPKLQTSRHPSKQVAQALAWLRVGKAKAQSRAMSALFKMLAGSQWAAKAAEILSAGGVHAIITHLGSPDPTLRDAAVRTLAKLAQAEAASAPAECPSEALAAVISTLDSFTYAQASGFVVVERTQQQQPPADELFLAAVAAAAALQLFAITPTHCAAAVHNGALPAVVDALAAAAATGAAAAAGGCEVRPAPDADGCAAGSDAQPPADQLRGDCDQLRGDCGDADSPLLHASLVQQLTRTCHLLMLHDEGSKQQLLDLGLLPLLVAILCTQPAVAAATEQQPMEDPQLHPQLEAARALVCLAALPTARADLEAHHEALLGLRRLARLYSGCFAGQEVAQWLGVEPAAAGSSVGHRGPALAGGGSGLVVAGDDDLPPPPERLLEREGSGSGAAGASWLGAPCRAVITATAAASSAVMHAWRGPPGSGRQLSFPIDTSDEWGVSSGDVEQILLDMKPSDMQQ